MPDLIASPTALPVKTALAKKPAKQSAPKGSAFPSRKVRFGDYEAEDLVDENGMVRDGYDYSKHMKEMGHGKFYSANGQFESQNALARRVALPDDVLPSANETERLLDAITLTTDVMDSDLREALVNDEAFEEMDDDFMVQAATVDPNEDAADGFDYDAHIAKLMEAASGIPKVRGNLTDSEDDDDSEIDDNDEEFSDEEDDADKEESQRALDALFEKTLAEEYGDEDLGELEDDDPETRGELVLEGDLLKEIVDDFVSVRQDMLNDEGKIGNPFRTGNNLKQILEECEAERALEENDGTDLETDTVPEEDPEIERELQALYTRNAYLVAREQEQWDCETIVSTYSNLDNHPTLLTEEMPNKKKKKKAAAAAAAEKATIVGDRSQIMLSRKTGMPLGVFESAPKKPEAAAKPSKELPAVVTTKGKNETKEEKKARKEAVKQLKTQRRQEKKQWKTAFKEEEQRQSTQTVGGKVSIFKY